MIKSIEINPAVQKACLIRDEEDLIVAKLETEDSHSFGVIHPQIEKYLCYSTGQLNPQKENKNTRQDSIVSYDKKVIWHLNKVEEKVANQCKVYRQGGVRVSLLLKKRAKQSNLRLAWVMFYKIYHMYR